MNRRRKYTNRPRRRTPSPRSKPVKLNPELWVKDAKAIAACRESMLVDQGYKCAISSLPVDVANSTLDHAHLNAAKDKGRVRAVLQAEINLLEGRFLRIFQKSKLDYKYGLDFAEILISMGLYLQQDYSKNLLHFKMMNEVRTRIKRLNRKEIVDKLLKEYNIKEKVTTSKGDLVQRYVQEFVDKVERLEKEK